MVPRLRQFENITIRFVAECNGAERAGAVERAERVKRTHSTPLRGRKGNAVVLESVELAFHADEDAPAPWAILNGESGMLARESVDVQRLHSQSLLRRAEHAASRERNSVLDDHIEGSDGHVVLERRAPCALPDGYPG